LAAAATAEKNVLDKLVKNNEKLIDQLAKLTAKFESLLSPYKKLKYKEKNLLFVQYKTMATAIHMNKCTKGQTVRPALVLDHLMIVWQLVKIPRETALRRRIGCVVNMKKKGIG